MRNKIILLMPEYTLEFGSGSIIARRTVDLLKNDVEQITVITDGESDVRDIGNVRVLAVPIGMNQRMALLMARVGLTEDYLDFWVKNVFRFINGREKETIGFQPDRDVSVIAVCVGYLGTFRLGLEMKRKYDCTLILHFHDPIKYSIVNGEKYSALPCASREKYEKKYILSADKIVTCSNSFKKYLIEKYPGIDSKIKNYYFGWIESPKEEYSDKKFQDNRLVITYGGAFGDVQGPEILGNALKDINGVTVYYIGNWNSYKPIKDMEGSNIVKLPRMDHHSYIRFLIEETDIGFLSLSRSYFTACVPAKLYEYINTKKPILAALKESDTSRIINSNGYGISVDYSQMSIRNAIQSITVEDINNMKMNLKRDREKWDFNETMKDFSKWVIE